MDLRAAANSGQFAKDIRPFRTLQFPGATIEPWDQDPGVGIVTLAAQGAMTVYNVRDAPFNARGDGTGDDTAAIQAAIDEASGTFGTYQSGGIVFLPPGVYAITQLIMKPGVWLFGAGWFGHATNYTLLRHIAAFNDDMFQFQVNSGSSLGPLGMSNFQMLGHSSSTSGYGINFCDYTDGSYARIQDGCMFDWLFIRNFADGGTYGRSVGPGILGNFAVYFNGGPGMTWDSDNSVPEFPQMQGLSVQAIVGDGNSGPTLALKGLRYTSVVNLGFIKSEQRPNLDRDGGATGNTHVITFEDCDCPVTINALHHHSLGSTTDKPGHAIEILAGTRRPDITWNAATVRTELASQTVGTRPYLIYDNVAGEHVPLPQYSGHWGLTKPYGYDPRVPHLPGTSGNYISTPDHADLDITGDIELVVRYAPDDPTPAAAQTLISKSTASGNQRSYILSIDTVGRPTLSWSTDGTSGTFTGVTSTVVPTYLSAGDIYLKATRDESTGDCYFYTSPDNNTYTQLGTLRTSTPSSFYSSTASMFLGATGDGTVNVFAGRIYEAIIRNGIDGTTVAHYRGDRATSPRYEDSTSKIWTVNGSAWKWDHP